MTARLPVMTRREWLAACLAGAPALVAGPARAEAFAASAPLLQVGGRTADADPTTWSIAEMEHAFARGTATPIDVTAAYLARIEAVDPALHAFVTVARDRVLDETRRLLLNARGSTSTPPLFGVPVAHKDLLATRGVRTTGGSRLHADWVPDEDADLVARCQQAGAVMLGKTNTHELGGGVTTINPFFGATRHPGDPARIPGGSSGGSAAAVAARLALVATGSDTGGSIRIPAALCGCVGVKPTFGRLPTAGLLGACPSFDHVGVLTRTADDAVRVVAAVLTSDDTAARRAFVETSRAAAASLRGRRIGVPRPYFFDALETAVAASVEAALTRIREAGAVVSDVPLALGDDAYATMFEPTVVREIRTTYQRQWQRRPDAFSTEFAAVFEGPAPSDRALAQAMAERDAHRREVARLFDRVDVLVVPTVPVVAPLAAGPIDGMRVLRNTWPFNASGLPALSLPCGPDATGLPVGLQLVGASGDDARLLGIAAAVERSLAP